MFSTSFARSEPDSPCPSFPAAKLPCARQLVGLAAAALCLSTAHAKAAFDAQAMAQQTCYACHGEHFSGGRAPALAGGAWHHAHSDEDATNIILSGIPDAGMPPFGKTITPENAHALVAFIHHQDVAWESPLSLADGAVVHTQLNTFRVERFASDLENPWSFAFLPDQRILVTEKPGRLRIVDHGKPGEPIKNTPKVHFRQDGGLLSLALDPDFEKNGWIYLSFAENGQVRGTSMTRIVRGKIRDGSWVDEQTVWAAGQKFYYRPNEHYGCRLLFLQGKLYFTIGDRGHREAAQDLSNPCGKVHRVNPDGTVPADNPFVGRKHADPTIWSYGHRNPQGLAIDPKTGEIWEVEHGPRGGDELNHIHKGANYGWPIVTFGLNEDGSEISKETSAPGMIDPIAHWSPSMAPCPILFSESDRYPKWKDQLLVGYLRGQQIHRIALHGDTMTEQEAFANNLGRVRDIKTGPDGYIYVAVEHWRQPGAIWKLVPVEK